MIETKLSRRDSLRNIVAMGVAGGVVAIGATAVATTAAEAAQPHMERALADLQAALGQLQVAAPNKGGHRVKAMELVRQAIAETRRGMAAAG
ncbi:MAG: hypothetical protein WBA42_06170 [Mesorhizobium sp.]